MKTPPYCTDLPFEAEFIGGPVWRLDDPHQAFSAVEAATAAHVRLISCRILAGQTADDLRAAGFRNVECLVTLERRIKQVPFPAGIDHAGAQDAEACAAIAAQALREDRFHADPEIDDAAADRLKATWVRNAIAGRADAVFLVRDQDRVIGFNACLRRDDAAVIDLIAVAPEAQGQGAGRRLVQAMEAHYGAAGASMLRLGTQAANRASLAFYAALGFVETARQETWHWTFAE